MKKPIRLSENFHVFVLAAIASIIPLFVLVFEVPRLFELLWNSHFELGISNAIRTNSIKWTLTNVIGCLAGFGFVCAAVIRSLAFKEKTPFSQAFFLMFFGNVLSIGTIYLGLQHFWLFRGG